MVEKRTSHPIRLTAELSGSLQEKKGMKKC
jgi:hypothetical protein